MSEMITGAAQFDELAARLAAADFRGELATALHAVAEGPLTKAAHANARERLPKAGGLADRVASEPIVVQDRSSTIQAGVRVGTTSSDSVATNRGRVRHPVRGHMDRWVEQQIPNAVDWFDDAMRDGRGEVEAAVGAVLEATALKVTRV